MLTRLKIKIREGELVEPRSQIVSRRTNTPQATIVVAHEEGLEGMNEYENFFRKAFFEMSEMVKVLYEERNSNVWRELKASKRRWRKRRQASKRGWREW